MIKLLVRLFKSYILGKHQLPPGVLIHRRNGTILFEIEFNWYDETLNPVSLVREVHSNKIFSIRDSEMREFKEYSGSNSTAGSTL